MTANLFEIIKPFKTKFVNDTNPLLFTAVLLHLKQYPMNTLSQPLVANKLNEVHALAAAQLLQDREAFTNAERYMAVSAEQGQLLYFLAGLHRSQNMVEFGCSFYISAIYLAAAAKDNNGTVITTELEASKAAAARENFIAAGLSAQIDLRIGDALETLSDITKVDLLFLDGAKELYLPVFELLRDKLTPTAIVIADNIDKPETHNLVNTVRSADEFTSVTLFEGRMLAAYRNCQC
jgi:predicted O-methyltransferase YrrM